MKKIFLITFLFLSFMKLNASEFSQWNEKYPKDNDYIIESEVRYKWYKNEFIESIYELYNTEHLNMYNLNNYIYSEYKDTTTLPEEKEHREIIKYEISKKLDTNIFNTIIFNNLDINGSFYFEGVQVKNIKTNENYSFILDIEYKDGEIIKDLKLINQKLAYYGIEAYDKKIDNIKLNFITDFNINDIKLTIIYKSYNEQLKTMNIFLSHDKNYYTDAKKYDMNKHASTCLNGYCYLTIELSEFIDVNYNLTMYKYRDKLFRYDIYEKVYNDNFYNYLEGYEKDITTAKVFYRYKKNDLICLNENKENNTLEEPKDKIIGSLNEKIALNIPTKIKREYNYYLIFVLTFVIITVVLYLLLLIYKKIIKKCRTK